MYEGNPGETFCPSPSPGVTPYNELFGQAPPERGNFLELKVYERLGISRFQGYKGVGKIVI